MKVLLPMVNREGQDMVWPDTEIEKERGVVLEERGPELGDPVEIAGAGPADARATQRDDPP